MPQCSICLGRMRGAVAGPDPSSGAASDVAVPPLLTGSMPRAGPDRVAQFASVADRTAGVRGGRTN